MTTIPVDEAKDQLADLLAKAADGEEIVIVREDGSAFTLTPAATSTGSERGPTGSARENAWMADDFDDISEGFERYLGGSSTATSRDDAGATNGRSDAGATPGQRRPRSEMFGVLEGKIWIAPDFDDIPEGFEAYMPGQGT